MILSPARSSSAWPPTRSPGPGPARPIHCPWKGCGSGSCPSSPRGGGTGASSSTRCWRPRHCTAESRRTCSMRSPGGRPTISGSTRSSQRSSISAPLARLPRLLRTCARDLRVASGDYADVDRNPGPGLAFSLALAVGPPGRQDAWRDAGRPDSVAGAAPGRYGGDRTRPDAGEPSAAAAAPVGLRPEGRGGSCRPATARPRRPGPLTARSPRLFLSLPVVGVCPQNPRPACQVGAQDIPRSCGPKARSPMRPRRQA